MKLMPIVYVSDMGRAVDFYTALGLRGENIDRAGMWTELALGNAILALHYAQPLPKTANGRVELAMVSEEPLETFVAHLEASHVALERGITDEAFGRSIQVRDPDGLLIQINEHDTSLYT
jgi:catechol 2,3-dioxygenase-like lactoylglutathione lyase family enzyme